MVKNIVNDWQKQFPILSPYTPSTLYAKAGIILIGLRLDKVMSDTYRVILEILPLWVQEKRKISIPVFFVELFDKKGGQFFIQYQCISIYLRKQPNVQINNLVSFCERTFGQMIYSD